MVYNNGFNNGYNYNGYGYGYNNYTQPQYNNSFQNNQQVQSQQSGALKINNMNKTSLDEIKPYVLLPNNEIFALDREKPILYYKSCDINGNVAMRVFDLVEHKEKSAINQTEVAPTFNAEDYLKKEDSKNFATYNEIQTLSAQISMLSERLDKLSRSDKNDRNERNKQTQ